MTGVEQNCQRAEQARLGLAAKAEQDEIVTREDGVDDLRDDRLVVADDAGKNGPAGFEPDHQVLADLGTHGPIPDPSRVDFATQSAKGRR